MPCFHWRCLPAVLAANPAAAQQQTADIATDVIVVTASPKPDETTDIIERLCIEAALKLTDDNRASAAEILGLSRQGLYSKLKRFGIEDKN